MDFHWGVLFQQENSMLWRNADMSSGSDKSKYLLSRIWRKEATLVSQSGRRHTDADTLGGLAVCLAGPTLAAAIAHTPTVCNAALHLYLAFLQFNKMSIPKPRARACNDRPLHWRTLVPCVYCSHRFRPGLYCLFQHVGLLPAALLQVAPQHAVHIETGDQGDPIPATHEQQAGINTCMHVLAWPGGNFENLQYSQQF